MSMTTEQLTYATNLLTGRTEYLERFIAVEDSMSKRPEDTAEQRETAAKRAAAYRAELTLARDTIAALGSLEPEQGATS